MWKKRALGRFFQKPGPKPCAFSAQSISFGTGSVSRNYFEFHGVKKSMDSVESICNELDKLLSGMSASEYGNAGFVDQLQKLSAAAENLGMKDGKKLIDNLREVLKSFQAGTADEKSVAIRCTALEFYKNKIQDQGAAEDL
jgi:hypothetical protein